MKVHFIISRMNLEKDIDFSQSMIKVIKDAGHTLARDWLEDAYSKYKNSGVVSNDWSAIFKENLETVAKTDVIIAEASYDSFAVGYIIAAAVQQKKPILLLRRTDADKDAFVTGVESGWIVHAEYSNNDASDIVTEFLKDNDIQLKDMRFNFFIDRPIHNYLRWAALKTGKTKAEILRTLVEKEIERENS